MKNIVSNLIITPYLFIIHLGMIIWLMGTVKMIIKMIIRKKVTFNIKLIKICTALYGGIVGFLLPYFDAIYDKPGVENALPASLANMVALAVGSYLMQISNISGNWEHHWQFYIPYIVFGLIGGWGIGQMIIWFKNGIVATRKHKRLAHPN